MHEVAFHEPVHVGDLVTCFASVLRRGASSITVRVRVVAQAPYRGGMHQEPRSVTQAEVVYVNVDEWGKPLPLPA